MKKIFIRAAAFIAALAVAVTAAAAQETPDESEWASVASLRSVDDVAASTGSALLMEKETGTVLYEHNARDRLAPASVTKVMTMLLIAERMEAGLLSPEDTVTCSAHAASMGGSQIFLEEGEQMSAGDLLKSVAVASANDAAVALAEHIAGTESGCVEMMNDRARELGMEDTVFANCTGLPCEEEHLTSALDIAIMSRELIRIDAIKKYTSIWTDSVRSGSFGLSNTNKLIRFYQGATGLKTGFTQQAQYCLAATAERDGVEYIAVVMHAPSSDERFESAKLLLNYAFANFTLTEPAPDSAIPPVEVKLGKVGYIQPVLVSPGRILVKKSELGGLKRELELEQSVTAPVAAGRELGRLKVSDASGKVIYSAAIVAPQAVERTGTFKVFLRFLRLMLTGK
ncbi:MAG: D-alanyl-D-alanine carboxypeptidase [Oscillospiraceae bacterium]|nr:D-alanyl-D-alanine carboxypeptidase [Oscillospiraceae bacterium]